MLVFLFWQKSFHLPIAFQAHGSVLPSDYILLSLFQSALPEKAVPHSLPALHQPVR